MSQVSQIVAQVIALGAMMENATLYQQADGVFNEHDEWIEGSWGTGREIDVVTFPEPPGEERNEQPEGVHDIEVRRFIVAPGDVSDVRAVSRMSEGDAIRYNGRDFKVRKVADYRGFFDATATRPFTAGTLPETV